MNVADLVHLTSLDGRKGASFTKDGHHRLRLERKLEGDAKPLGFVCLNPSTATHEIDDPTIRREVGFAAREGCGGIIAGNLSPFRATDPDVLYRLVGKLATMKDLLLAFPPGHTELLIEAMRPCEKVIAAWGNFAGAARGARTVMAYRARELAIAFEEAGIPLWCLGYTADGWPRHPLYLPADAPLRRWTPPAERVR